MVESCLEKCLGWLCCFILMGLDFSSKVTSAEMSIMSIENNAIFAVDMISMPFYVENDPYCGSQFSCAQPERLQRRGKEVVFGAHHSYTGPSIEPRPSPRGQKSVELARQKPTAGRR